MSRNFGLGSKPDRCRIGQLADRYYILVVCVTVSVLIVGLGYLFG
jgi:hypothetical protein